MLNIRCSRYDMEYMLFVSNYFWENRATENDFNEHIFDASLEYAENKGLIVDEHEENLFI